MEFPHFLRHTVHTFGFDDTDGKASEAADVFRAMTGSYPATVLIEIPIDDIMTAILDAPVAAICLEQLLGVGLLWRAAGDTVGELDGAFPGFFLNALAFNHKGLSNVWKVKVVVQCAGGPKFFGSRYVRARERAPSRSPVPVDARNRGQRPAGGGVGCL